MKSLIGGLGLAVGVVGFALSSQMVLQAVSIALIGLAAGACQTLALTAVMRRAVGAVASSRASAAWNVIFDAGLGAGAYAAPAVLML